MPNYCHFNIIFSDLQVEIAEIQNFEENLKLKNDMLGSQASSFSDMKISSDLMRIEMKEIIVNTKNKIIQIDEINTANRLRKQEIEREREIERENEI